MSQWQSIDTAPHDRVILTDQGTARYVDPQPWASPVKRKRGWYLCFACDHIPWCAEDGMAISEMDPKYWMDIPPLP